MAEKPKFVFTCQRCGRCCQGREVQVHFCDLERWHRDGFFYQVLPHLRVLGDSGGTNQILLGGSGSVEPSKGGDGEAADAQAGPCPFYDAGKKECTQYQHRPVSCRAFPLCHDGDRYHVADISCPGLGRGPMTTALLAAIRDDAATEHLASRELRGTLPPLYALFTRLLLEDSARRLDGLTEEQKRKLFELFGPGRV